jgi:N-acyl homoserine lactone hydrolase
MPAAPIIQFALAEALGCPAVSDGSHAEGRRPGMALRALPRVERLDLAWVELPESHPAASHGRSVPVYGYLIDHPDGPIVVDTGVGHGNAFVDEAYRPQRTGLAASLDACGVDVSDVVAVVNSHLHFDHCGQNGLLYGGDARFYVQRAEVAAVEDDPFYTVSEWALGPIETRRVVDGDEVVADGVTVLATPGHTVGHQSVVIEAGDGRVVIGAQVVWHTDEFEDEVASPANVDPVDEMRTAAVESIRRLKALNPRAVYFSHCASYQPLD